ncbi:GPS-CTERM domain-containing protein, partial [Kitasatospora indigofera]
VPTGASSAEVLAALAPPLRYDGAGILCAIAGYPAAGCGEALAGTAPAPGGPDGSDGSAGPDLGLIAGGAAVAVLTAGAVWQARRRR